MGLLINSTILKMVYKIVDIIRTTENERSAQPAKILSKKTTT